MGLSLVQEEAGAAEGGVRAEGAPVFLQLGVLTVLVVLQRLSVAGAIRAVFAIIDITLFLSPRVFGQHVGAKLVFSLAGIGADLADERFCLMSQFVAIQLVHAVCAVGTLVAVVPKMRT